MTNGLAKIGIVCEWSHVLETCDSTYNDLMCCSNDKTIRTFFNCSIRHHFYSFHHQANSMNRIVGYHRWQEHICVNIGFKHVVLRPPHSEPTKKRYIWKCCSPVGLFNEIFKCNLAFCTSGRVLNVYHVRPFHWLVFSERPFEEGIHRDD